MLIITQSDNCHINPHSRAFDFVNNHRIIDDRDEKGAMFFRQ